MIFNQTRWQSGFQFVLSGFVACCAACICSAANAGDVLPSWNDGAAKTAILEFVAAVTEKGGRDYVEPAERIATFDHDGTLWVEYPMYTQVLFAFDRVKTLAPQHPEWKTTQPFKALLEGDMKTVGASGMKGLMEILMATHSGMTAAARSAGQTQHGLVHDVTTRFMGLIVLAMGVQFSLTGLEGFVSG